MKIHKRIVKKKHGFTLVELIVVVAIIGVLAAILVPTFFNVVIKARVTSANSTANSIRKCMNVMLMQADPTNYGIVSNTTMKLYITVTKTDGKSTWRCSAAQSGSYNNNNRGHYTWGSAGSFTEGGTNNSRSGEAMICERLCGDINLDYGSAVVVLNSGQCTFVAYTTDTASAMPETEYPTVGADGKAPDTFVWNGKTAGVSPQGWIVGTAPPVDRAIPGT